MAERHLHEVIPGLELRDILEGMSKDAIVDYILTLGEHATRLESDMNLAAEVLEGAHGVTVADVLTERENTNGEPA